MQATLSAVTTSWVGDMSFHQRLTLHAGCLASCPVGLSATHQDDLDGQGADDALGVHQGGVAQVVQTCRAAQQGVFRGLREAAGSALSAVQEYVAPAWQE